ncbi:CBS domain-containing protein [Pyxidicoccus xibeiensis]|uniref:CBS domain-containing protein n=1 Tax=Pyxidicoccus xibeiensis TaxID=2906759 RepID=UPI0020A80B6E|nr:CBS domain-containing protein [Pyxidicoccus xibeiensis]MCP3144530.1 CBS domain-containing protein [Pyxidicoccus xibeiensis]
MATTPKNPDLSTNPGDLNRGLSTGGPGDDLSNGRGATRPQDAAGRQTYGLGSGLGSTTGGTRDFYREALARGASSRGREDFRYSDRREDYGSNLRGEVGPYTNERVGMQGREESWREQPRRYEQAGEGYRGSEGMRGQQTYRSEEWNAQRPTERYDVPYEGRGEEHSERGGRPSGRTMALAAAGLGAAGVGLGLMRRGRWAKEPLCARDVMSRGVKTVLPEQTLREVARLMREENVGIVPVTDLQGRLLGVVTDRDLVVRAMSEDRLPSQVRVTDIMSSEDLEVATPDDSVHDLIELMGRKQVRRIPVVERDNRLVGIIAMGDIATRAEFDEELQDALERISSRRSFWSRLG